MYAERLRASLPRVTDRIAAAAERAGRDPSSVRIVAVTKGHGLDAVRAALEAGLVDLGENRVEELEGKASATSGGRTPATRARWHMIGHLQRRKAPRVLGVAHLVHSVDSVKLAERLAGAAEAAGTGPLPILVQANTSGESSKSGLGPDELPGALEEMAGLSGVAVRGLMTMAPLTEDEAVLRSAFQRLRELHEEARRSVEGYEGTELSMGMSNDYEIAVEEGSTMVRLGTVLLGERPE